MVWLGYSKGELDPLQFLRLHFRIWGVHGWGTGENTGYHAEILRFVVIPKNRGQGEDTSRDKKYV